LLIVELKSLVTRLNTNKLAKVKDAEEGCVSSELHRVQRNIAMRQGDCRRIFEEQDALAARLMTGNEMTEVHRDRLA